MFSWLTQVVVITALEELLLSRCTEWWWHPDVDDDAYRPHGISLLSIVLHGVLRRDHRLFCSALDAADRGR